MSASSWQSLHDHMTFTPHLSFHSLPEISKVKYCTINWKHLYKVSTWDMRVLYFSPNILHFALISLGSRYNVCTSCHVGAPEITGTRTTTRPYAHCWMQVSQYDRIWRGFQYKNIFNIFLFLCIEIVSSFQGGTIYNFSHVGGAYIMHQNTIDGCALHKPDVPANPENITKRTMKYIPRFLIAIKYVQVKLYFPPGICTGSRWKDFVHLKMFGTEIHCPF